MGAVKHDTTEKSRQYSVSYALNDKAGVAALLRDRHRIGERRYRGDNAASDIIIDLHSAIESAGLTERQAEAIAWVYGIDVTQAKAAEIMGVAQSNISEYLTEACDRIAGVYAKWEYGEITVSYEDTTTTVGSDIIGA